MGDAEGQFVSSAAPAGASLFAGVYALGFMHWGLFARFYALGFIRQGLFLKLNNPWRLTILITLIILMNLITLYPE